MTGWRSKEASAKGLASMLGKRWRKTFTIQPGLFGAAAVAQGCSSSVGKILF